MISLNSSFVFIKKGIVVLLFSNPMNQNTASILLTQPTNNTPVFLECKSNQPFSYVDGKIVAVTYEPSRNYPFVMMKPDVQF